MVKTKGGRLMNPADSFRKEQRKKEVARNRLERKFMREAADKRDKPEEIKKELQSIISQEEKLAAGEQLPLHLRLRKKALQEGYDAALKKKKEEKLKAQAGTAAPADPATGAIVVKPEDSPWYHPTLNPTGAPPPGKASSAALSAPAGTVPAAKTAAVGIPVPKPKPPPLPAGPKPTLPPPPAAPPKPAGPAPVSAASASLPSPAASMPAALPPPPGPPPGVLPPPSLPPPGAILPPPPGHPPGALLPPPQGPPPGFPLMPPPGPPPGLGHLRPGLLPPPLGPPPGMVLPPPAGPPPTFHPLPPPAGPPPNAGSAQQAAEPAIAKEKKEPVKTTFTGASTVAKRPLAQNDKTLTTMVPASVRVRREEQKPKIHRTAAAASAKDAFSGLGLQPVPRPASLLSEPLLPEPVKPAAVKPAAPAPESVDKKYLEFMATMSELGAFEG